MLSRTRGAFRSFPYIHMVPQQSAWVIERLGKFHKVLEPGLRVVLPVVDRISSIQSLKEEVIELANQHAITTDNVAIQVDAVLFVKVVDPYKATYGVENVAFAMTQLATTSTRSELGKITLDRTFSERENLNAHIINSINAAAEEWGVKCMRYEIRDVSPPAAVMQSMQMQAEAERRKRATILDSEAVRQAEINIAEAKRQVVVLQAQADAESTTLRAKAIAEGITVVSKASRQPGGKDAISLRVAEQYVAAFSGIAKQSTTIVVPSNASDISSMVTQAMAIYSTLATKKNGESEPEPEKNTTIGTSATAQKFVQDLNIRQAEREQERALDNNSANNPDVILDDSQVPPKKNDFLPN